MSPNPLPPDRYIGGQFRQLFALFHAAFDAEQIALDGLIPALNPGRGDHQFLRTGIKMRHTIQNRIRLRAVF
jgi:hypothetical protein